MEEFFAEATHYMDGITCDQNTIKDMCEQWKEKVETRFHFRKERFVRDLLGDMPRGVYHHIFKMSSGTLIKRLSKKGPRWERLFIHSYDPQGEFWRFSFIHFRSTTNAIRGLEREGNSMWKGEKATQSETSANRRDKKTIVPTKDGENKEDQGIEPRNESIKC
jgi:hypothetical protein